MPGGPEGELGPQRAPRAECVCHTLNIRTDYMCHTYIRGAHLLSLGALWGPSVYQSSASVLSTIRGNGGGAQASSHHQRESDTCSNPGRIGGEGRRLCRAGQDSSPPAPGRVPSLSVGRHAGANDTAISPAAISEGPHGVSSRTQLGPKYQGRGREAFA